MAFRLLDMAQQSWRRLNGSHLLPLVRASVKFVAERDHNLDWKDEAFSVDKVSTEADVEAIREWFQRYDSTVVAGDRDGWTDLLADDIVWAVPE